MRLGHVIGKVTLSTADPSLRGARFLLVQPFGKAQFAGAPAVPLAKGATLVVYDSLSAGEGQVIGFTEGAEAMAPFPAPEPPIDAFNATIVDHVFYTPPGTIAAPGKVSPIV